MAARFFVLDGVDGCGKSTQARALCERLTVVRDAPPLHVREPGSTAAGERIAASCELQQRPRSLDASEKAGLGEGALGQIHGLLVQVCGFEAIQGGCEVRQGVPAARAPPAPLRVRVLAATLAELATTSRSDQDAGGACAFLR